MEGEWTMGELMNDLQERLAEARTRALLGEREAALGMLRGAVLEFARFREVLKGETGYHALEHALDATLHSMNEEVARAEARPKSTRRKAIRKQAA